MHHRIYLIALVFMLAGFLLIGVVGLATVLAVSGISPRLLAAVTNQAPQLLANGCELVFFAAAVGRRLEAKNGR